MCDELGDGVAHALVDAAGDVAALDVRERQVQIRGRHRNGQLLEAIAADDDDVGSMVCRPLVNSSAVRQAVFAIATWLPPSMTFRNEPEMREPAGLDVVGDVAAVLVEQDRAAEHQLELDAPDARAAS